MQPRSPLPATIGRFRIDALLGAGGMGEVYKAVDPTLQRVVAIKTVRSDVASPDLLVRLYREAQACARLRHPNVVTVYEAGEAGGLVYITMEYLEGEDVRALLKRGALSFLEKLEVLLHVLAALQHTHAESVIHRDIKPSNVHRGLDGTVKVVDFGLAQMVLASPLTRPGAVMCTPEYASPEQLRDEPLDARTDIYSTGALAYEMFAGRQPFRAGSGSVGALILKAVSEPPPPMDVTWSRAFPEMERIVTKAMAKSPDDRYQSAEEMRLALSAFLASSRDAIVAAQAQFDAEGRRAVSEARTLIVAGRRADAETLLAATIKLNPEATEARHLLDDTRQAEVRERAPQPPSAPADEAPAATPTPHMPLAEAGAGTRATALRTEPVQVRHDADPAVPGSSSISGVPRASAATTRWWWLGGLAAAAAAFLIVALSQLSGSSPAPSPAPTMAADADAPENGAARTIVAAAPTAGVPDPPAPTAPPSPKGTAVTSASATRATTSPATSKGATPSASSATDAGRRLLESATAAEPATPAARTGAKQMFASRADSAGGVNPGLRYRLTRLTADGLEGDVDPTTTTFHSGDRIRFTFESNIDGFLYVVQQGSSGRWTVLFPGPRINGGRNAVGKSAQYQVPSNDWFLFDEIPGTEQVFVFLSREPMQLLPGFDRPVTRTETVVESVVQDLRQRIQSRDLVLEKDRPSQAGGAVQATYVVNRHELSQAVSASITLVHAQ